MLDEWYVRNTNCKKILRTKFVSWAESARHASSRITNANFAVFAQREEALPVSLIVGTRSIRNELVGLIGKRASASLTA